MKATEYHLYRYFIINNKQVSLTDITTDITREDIEKKFLEIFNNEKIKHNTNSKDYILYPIDSYENKLFICKLSKETKITLHREGDKDIDTDEESDYPYVYIIINTENQIILIQKNTSVFEDTLSAKNRLTEILQKFVREYNYTINIDSIADKEQFWTAVSKAKKLYSLNLRLSAPNLFGARVKANEFMKEQKEEYNLSLLEVKMNNLEGNLCLSKENLDDFVEYATEGGGGYNLSYEDENNIKRTIDSKNTSKKILLSSEITKEEYDNIISEMRRIDNLSGLNE